MCGHSGQVMAGARESPAGHVRCAGTVLSTLYPQRAILTTACDFLPIGQDGLGWAAVTNSPTDLSDCKPPRVVSWSCSMVTAGHPGSSRKILDHLTGYTRGKSSEGTVRAPIGSNTSIVDDEKGF